MAIENEGLADLRNDGFESGSLSAWTVANGSNASLSTWNHSGNYSIVESGPVDLGVTQMVPD